MEKTLKRLGLASWLSIPLGLIMYFGTVNAFGNEISIPLGIIAASSFALIIRRSRDRIVSEVLAKEIREAIHRFGQIENFIEIKKSNRTGIIARIYLINAGNRAGDINQAVRSRLESSMFKGRIWILQLTDMASRDELNVTRQALDMQLIEELKKMAKENRNNKTK